jgi:hypothetical protein
MSPKLKGMLVVSLTVLAAIAAGTLSVTQHSATHTSAGAAQGGETRTYKTVYGPALWFETMKLPQSSGYVTVKVCHGEASEAPDLPAGVDAIAGTEWEDGTCTAGEPLFEVWSDLDPDAPFLCACSTGASCEQLYQPMGQAATWRAAPTGQTLSRGEWRGSGCRRRPCIAIAGHDQWPSECPR